MVRLIEIFHWMFEDERWRYKMFFQALLLLVPVAGLLALLGWMAITCENLLAGRQDLARAGLHLRRGAPPLAMGVVYWIGLGVPYSLLRSLDGLWPGQLPLGAVAQVYNDLALLLYALLIVPVFAATTSGGLGAGLDLARLATSIRARPLRTLVAGVVVLIALVIGALGFTLIVAAPFTITYAASVVAGVAAWWAVPGRAGDGDGAVPGRNAGGTPVPFRPPGA